MILGFTYDLKSDYLSEGFTEEDVAEFDSEETIAGIETALHNIGYEVQRIGNVKSLIGRLAKGQRWDIVFNICEGVKGFCREAQVPVILDAYEIPYVFSDGMTMMLSLHKAMSKQIVRNAGIKTADFTVVQKLRDLDVFELRYPVFVKPLAEGTGKGISSKSKCSNERELKNLCQILLTKNVAPILVETYLPGREFTTGIVGTGEKAQSIGTMEIKFRNTAENTFYSYEHKANYEDYVDYAIPERAICDECNRLALKIWKLFNCRDGGRIDFKMDAEGKINFLELNPLAGLNPIHSDLPILARLHHIPYTDLIEMIMNSALDRIKR